MSVDDETPQLPQKGSPLFQISEEDLTELEKCIPALLSHAMARLDDNLSRVRIRRVKEILSNVRWDYGPWSNVTEIPAD